MVLEVVVAAAAYYSTKGVGTYECWKRRRQRAQRKSLSGNPTSPHMEHTVVPAIDTDGDAGVLARVDWNG